MKTPEQIFDEIDDDPGFIGCHRRIVAIECMKRFGLQCWNQGRYKFAPDTFPLYLKDLYLNEIAKQAQDDGECK